MSFSKKQLEELENFFSQRPRDPGAPPVTGLPYPEIVDNAPSTGGGEFSVQDLLTLLEYEQTGQFPELAPPPPPVEQQQKLGPHLLPAGGFPAPEGPQHGPPAPEPRAQIGPPIDLGSDEPIKPVAQRPEQEQRTPAELLEILNQQSQAQTPMPGADFAAASAAPVDAAPEEQELMQQLSGFTPQQGGPGAVNQEEELLMRQLAGEDIGEPHDIPLETEEHYQNIDTDRLEGTLDRQRNEVERLTGEEAPEKDENPGMVGKIFDVLLRPNYAMAEGVMGARQEEGLDRFRGFAEGAREGFTGREKTTFADVIDDIGEGRDTNTPGWLKGGVGFALDVALDPTTYIGGGIVKAGTKGAAEAAAAKASNEVMNNPQAIESAMKVANQKVHKEALDAVKHGKKAGPKLSDVGVGELAQRELRGLASDAGRAALKAAQTPGKVDFSFAGKHIGSSEKLYSGVSRAFRPLRELEPVQALNVMFRPKAELGDIHGLTRMHEGISVGMFQDHMQHFRHLTKGINATEAKQISQAIEGTRHIDDPKLLETKELVERMFKQFWDDEVALGIHAADAIPRDNYLYHVYKTGFQKADRYKQAHQKGAAGFTKERKYPTLEQAKKDGMRPIEDIRQIVAERAAKHFKEVSHHSFMSDAVENFGVHAGTKTAKEVEGIAKGMGIGLEKVSLPGKSVNGVKEALFPEPIARALKELQTVNAEDKAAGSLLRYIDKAHQETKFWMTVANPGHHVRNFVGNAYMAYQGGVRNPARYAQAARAVAGDLAQPGTQAYKQAMEGKVKIGNGFSSYDELMQLYKMTGTKSGYYDIEIARTATGKARDAIRTASTAREDTARLGQFIDTLAKDAKKKGWNWGNMAKADKVKAARNASERTRHFQLDYGDLTTWEKKYARRFAMFYTFARKNTALQLEMLALRPGRTANVPKFNTAVEQLLGVHEDPDELDDFQSRIPEWVLEMNSPQVGGSNNIIQQILGTENPTYAGINLPTQDLNRLGGPRHIMDQLVSDLRPEMKIPLESSFDQQAFSGAPLPDRGQYTMQQLPITNLVRKYLDEDTPNKEAHQSLAGWLTGMSIQEVTPRRQQSELRRQQQPVQDIIRDTRADNLEEFLKEIEQKRGRKK